MQTISTIITFVDVYCVYTLVGFLDANTGIVRVYFHSPLVCGGTFSFIKIIRISPLTACMTIVVLIPHARFVINAAAIVCIIISLRQSLASTEQGSENDGRSDKIFLFHILSSSGELPYFIHVEKLRY